MLVKVKSYKEIKKNAYSIGEETIYYDSREINGPIFISSMKKLCDKIIEVEEMDTNKWDYKYKYKYRHKRNSMKDICVNFSIFNFAEDWVIPINKIKLDLI